MRFPTTITLNNETYNVSDHQLVFQLAAEMNKLNNHDANLSVDFIPYVLSGDPVSNSTKTGADSVCSWYQSNENGLYYYNGIKLANGMPPTLAQITANSSLEITLADDPSTTALETAVDDALPGTDFMIQMAQNMFKAHKEWLGELLCVPPFWQTRLADSEIQTVALAAWAATTGRKSRLPTVIHSCPRSKLIFKREFAYMVNYLKGSLNDTDVISAGNNAYSFWDDVSVCP
jgi:hypothetical protein